MLRIYDDVSWRQRRQRLLLLIFLGGAAFGALLMNAAPAGSDSVPERPVRSPGCDAQGSGLRLACSLTTTPR